MRKLLCTLAAVAACSNGAASARAQDTPAPGQDMDILPLEIREMYVGFLLPLAELQLTAPIVKITADPDKASGVYEGEIGLIVIPQKDFKVEGNGDVDKDPGAPLGHLFMSEGYAPVIDGKRVEVSKMARLTLPTQDGGEAGVSYMAITLKKGADGQLHVCLYGADPKPLLDLKAGECKGDDKVPVFLEVKEYKDGAGKANLTILGKMNCSFPVSFVAPPAKPAAHAPAN